jgi:hypothetical protein
VFDSLGHIRPIDEAKLAEMKLEAGAGCLGAFMEGENACLVFEFGSLMFIPGESEAVWHAYDNPELIQEWTKRDSQQTEEVVSA